MKKIDVDGFIEFIENLQVGVPSKVFARNLDGEDESFSFLKIEFSGDTIVLYETYCGATGVIQDTPVAPWEDYAEGVYEDLNCDGECELFIK